MAKKKFYAVRKGKTIGVFSSWTDCKAAVDGYPGADFKGFPTLEEAKEYVGDLNGAVHGECDSTPDAAAHGKCDIVSDAAAHGECDSRPDAAAHSDALLAYVDGSYNDSLKKYAFGCVFLFGDGRIYTEYGNGDNPQSLQHRNVTGEMLGAMYAVRFAMLNGFKEIEIRYDYEGIEKWVTGAWRSKTELTQKYAEAMREWGKSIRITFTKVAAHTNIKYNELADQMAKKGLTEGNGIPKVRKAEEMTVYQEENQIAN